MGLEFFAKLGLNSSGFDAGLRKAEGAIEHFGGGLQSKLGHLLGGAAILELAHKTVEFARTMADMSRTFGVSAERLQELDFAAKQTGGSLEAMATAMKKLAEARAEAIGDPGGEKAKSFALFGIGAETLKATTDPSELLLKLSDALKGAKLDMDSLPKVLDLIGARNLSIIPALQSGLRDAGDMAHRLGLILKNETVEALEAAGKAGDRAGRRILAAFAPVLEGLAKFSEKGVTGWQMMLAGDEAGTKALGKNSRNPLMLLSKTYWQAFLREANRVRDAAQVEEKPQKANLFGGMDPEQLFANQQKLLVLAEHRARLEQQLAEKRREFKLGGLKGPELIAALEAEKANLLGPGVEPGLEQELKAAGIDLELQSARHKLNSTHDKSFDSMAAVGLFGPHAADSEARDFHTQIRQDVARVARVLERIQAQGIF